MTTPAESAIQQTTVGDPSQQGGAKDKGKTKSPKPSGSPGSSGLQYLEDYPRSIKKTIEPLPKEDVDILFDFGVPDDEKKLLIKKDILEDLLIAFEQDTKAPRYWFNKLAEKSQKYEDALWLILNLKATLLSSSNANLLKEWRLNDRVKVPPQDIQEVAAIASLYEKKTTGNEKIIDTNSKIVKDSIFNGGDKAEKRKEILLNIALGNLGGLYKKLAIWGEGEEGNETEAKAV